MVATYNESATDYEEFGLAYDGSSITTTVSIGSPFDDSATVVSSSASGHHTPYGGDESCDLDISGTSRGTPVKFKISANHGASVRGRVDQVPANACASNQLADGGKRVRVLIERLAGGSWVSTNKRVHYAHLDPVSVSNNDIVSDGDELGELGPDTPAGFPADTQLTCGHSHGAGSPFLDEYHSTCACHSHVHVEGEGATSVVDVSSGYALGDTIMEFDL
jgi:hypothetical protein